MLSTTHKERVTLQRQGKRVIDASSRAPRPYCYLSLLHLHGNIPIPGMEGRTADAVEGIWPGLKVFQDRVAVLVDILNHNLNGLVRYDADPAFWPRERACEAVVTVTIRKDIPMHRGAKDDQIDKQEKPSFRESMQHLLRRPRHLSEEEAEEACRQLIEGLEALASGKLAAEKADRERDE